MKLIYYIIRTNDRHWGYLCSLSTAHKPQVYPQCSSVQIETQQKYMFCLISTQQSQYLQQNQWQARRWMDDKLTKSLLCAVLLAGSCEIWNKRTASHIHQFYWMSVMPWCHQPVAVLGRGRGPLSPLTFCPAPPPPPSFSTDYLLPPPHLALGSPPPECFG